MSTEPESQPPQQPLEFLELTDKPTEKDDALAVLEAALQNEADRRREERFIWIVVTIILLDILLLKDAENPTLPIVVMVFELVALVIVARRLGMENLAVMLDRLVNKVDAKP